MAKRPVAGRSRGGGQKKGHIFLMGFLTPLEKIRAWKLQIGGLGHYRYSISFLYGIFFRFIRASTSIKQKMPMLQ